MSKDTDEIGNKNLVRQLETFGLSEKEARVYIALLPYRDIGSSKLIRATGLHGQFVYDALNTLEELGLAKHVVQNGRKKFSANTPNRLLSLVEEKRLAAQSVAHELQKRFAGIHEQNFEVFQGENSFAAHQIELLRQLPIGFTINVIASEGEIYNSTIEQLGFWDEYEQIREERKIHVRYLGAETQREQLQKREHEMPRWEYRILPGLSGGIMNTDIWNDRININIFGDPILSLTTTSKEIADGYRQFFEAIWNLSSK